MAFVRRTVRFGAGLVLGAAVSTAVSMLLAPQSGAELQGAISDRLEEAERAGEEAEILETERLKREFRTAVNDPAALTGKYGKQKEAEPTPEEARQAAHDKALQEAHEAQEEAAKDRRAAAKARAEAEQKQQEAAEAERKATEARHKAIETT